jgi:WD40 repeat protein
VRSFAHTAPPAAVAFSPDGRTLAWLMGNPDNRLHVWEAGSAEPRAFAGHTATGLSLAYHPVGHLIATSAADGTVLLWDVRATPPRLETFGPGPFGRWAGAVAFSVEGRYLFVGNYNGTISALRLAPVGVVPEARAENDK